MSLALFSCDLEQTIGRTGVSDAAFAQSLESATRAGLDDRDLFRNDLADAIDAEPCGDADLIRGESSFAILIEHFTPFGDGIGDKPIR